MARNRVFPIGVGVDLATYDPSWQTVAATNFKGAGKADVLRENMVTGDRGIWVMNTPGRRTPTGFIWARFRPPGA